MKRLPVGFTFLMVLISLGETGLKAISQGDPSLFIAELGKRIFLSDLGLRTNIETLRAGGLSQSTRMYMLMQNISDILMIYYLNKYIAKGYASITGRGGAWFGYWITSITVLGAIEFGMAGALRGEIIVPYMGVWMFMSNLGLYFEPIMRFYANWVGTIRYIEKNNKTIADLALGNYNVTQMENFTRELAEKKNITMTQ